VIVWFKYRWKRLACLSSSDINSLSWTRRQNKECHFHESLLSALRCSRDWVCVVTENVWHKFNAGNLWPTRVPVHVTIACKLVEEDRPSEPNKTLIYIYLHDLTRLDKTSDSWAVAIKMYYTRINIRCPINSK